MRIGIAAHSAGRSGGVETYLASVIPALAACGHEIACWFEIDARPGESIVPASHDGPLWIAAPRAANPLHPLRQWRPDLVYLHGLRSDRLERGLTGFAPVALFAHSYYGACISGEKTTRFPMARPCTRVLGPGCLLHYLPRGCGGLSPVTMVVRYQAQRRRQQLLADFNAVLVASHHMAREYAAHGIRATVVPYPVAGAEQDQRSSATAGQEGSLRADAQSGDAAQSWNLLFLGRLERSKGVEIALLSSARAVRLLDRPVRLVIAGEGSQREAYRRDAARLVSATPGLAIEFAGWLEVDGRAAALDQADLLLVPSIWPEPFGLVGVEAAAAGVPAIAFNVGGIHEWLDDGVAGRLVPLAGDKPGAFAVAIARTLADPAGLSSMRAAARAAAARFTMAAHLRALDAVFKDVTGRAAGASGKGRLA